MDSRYQVPGTRAPSLDGRAKVNKSCYECRRRKIACDGNQPCNKCVYYQVQDCHYYIRKRRKLSQKTGKVGSEVDSPIASANFVLNKLFPSHSPLFLAQLSREELLHLANNGGILPSRPSPNPLGPDEPFDIDAESDGERKWNESQKGQNPEEGMCDDVNGLSLRLHNGSYLGVSSSHAILRTIINLSPSIQTDLKYEGVNEWRAAPLTSPTIPNGSDTSTSLQLRDLVPTANEEMCVSEFFSRFHEICPVLDEVGFLTEWRRGDRFDRPWLALLNIVLAIGSLGVGDASDRSHEIYYARAKEYLDFGLLGTGCIECVQTLCLLGGYYLHHKNSPNMGYAVLGAAYRIAIALGLHREPTKMSNISGSSWNPTIRRKIWWCLFCADTYTSMTLGRTTLGRWDPGTMNITCPNEYEKKDPAVLSLDCAQEFCMIATRWQHRFAQFQPLRTHEIETYDCEAEKWFQNLPGKWHVQNPGCHRSQLAKSVIHNRYYHFRLLLFRPLLLSYANRRVPLSSVAPDDQTAIQKCQTIACQAIDKVVVTTHSFDKLSAWSASWFLYQATLVVLLCVIIDPDNQEAKTWRSSIEKALSLFEKLSPWSPSADRSRQILSKIYDTCGVTSVNLDPIVEDGIDMAMFDQMELDIFNEGWNWDASYWSSYLIQYPEWTGE